METPPNPRGRSRSRSTPDYLIPSSSARNFAGAVDILSFARRAAGTATSAAAPEGAVTEQETNTAPVHVQSYATAAGKLIAPVVVTALAAGLGVQIVQPECVTESQQDALSEIQNNVERLVDRTTKFVERKTQAGWHLAMIVSLSTRTIHISTD